MRIACLSDTHETSPDYHSNSLFPDYINSLPPEERQKEYEHFRSVIADCHEEAVRRLEQQAIWDILIHLGDMTGGWNEQGLDHPTVVPLAQRSLSNYYRVARYVGVCWGNHDTGYGNAFGGLSLQSVRRCQELSPLFWMRDAGEIFFLGICSPLLTQHDGPDWREISELRQAQFDFVSDTLRMNPRRRWVLCSHDPNIRELSKVASAHANTLKNAVYGDKHSIWAGSLEKMKGYAQLGFANLCRRRSIFCPSTAPLWWHGCSYLAGAIENGKLHLSVQRYSSPHLDQQIRSVPFSSFFKSARWMLSFKVKHILKHK